MPDSTPCVECLATGAVTSGVKLVARRGGPPGWTGSRRTPRRPRCGPRTSPDRQVREGADGLARAVTDAVAPSAPSRRERSGRRPPSGYTSSRPGDAKVDSKVVNAVSSARSVRKAPGWAARRTGTSLRLRSRGRPRELRPGRAVEVDNGLRYALCRQLLADGRDSGPPSDHEGLEVHLL